MDLNAIKGFNPWWTNYNFRFSEEGYIKRQVIEKLDKYFDVPQILSVLGLRRSGKTTILKYYINRLLNQGISADRILFFSFEDYLGRTEAQVLDEILNVYFQRYLQKDIWDIKERYYIFLDEIQYISHWQDILKRFYDKNKNLKFIISGSFSAVIRKKSTESLAGRIFEVFIPLFSFYEYCLLKKAVFKFSPLPVDKLAEVTPGELKDMDRAWQLYSTELELFYEEYLYKGQFPEISVFREENLVSDYIRGSVLKKILTEDAPRIFRIEKAGEFSSIYKIISKETGSLFELLNLAREVGISKDTLNNYFYYLEHLFLAKLIYNYTGKLRRQYRIQKKIYVTSPNFTCNELNINNNSPSFSLILGSLVETAVFQMINYEYEEILFWRQREKEVDFIVKDSRGNVIPIEVKYVNRILSKHLNNLVHFMEHNNLKSGVVITKNEARILLMRGMKILFIPVWVLTI